MRVSQKNIPKERKTGDTQSASFVSHGLEFERENLRSAVNFYLPFDNILHKHPFGKEFPKEGRQVFLLHNPG